MRFEEVTQTMLNVTIATPGHKDDGKTVREALPSLTTARIWGARHGGYTWSIMYEPGLPSWSDEDKQKYIGYTCSYRRAEHNSSSQTIRIDGGPFKSFKEAENACKRMWKQLRHIQ